MSQLSEEDARIARHLAGAEAELRARSVDHLPPSVRTVRAFLIEALREYRLAGRFPRNLVRGEQTPVFIDPFGTRCAMAHLLELVGAHALVERVARQANLARIRQLAGDEELLRWLAAMGLTVEEAARIQPAYCTMSRADCWCGGSGAEAVVLATPLSAADAAIAAKLRVDEVLGGSLVRVGEEIAVDTRVTPTSGQVLVGLRRHGVTGEIQGWLSPSPDGAIISAGNCETAARTIAPPRSVLVDALMSKECPQALIAHDARFAVSSCDADPTAVPDAGVVGRNDDVASSSCSWAVPATSNAGVMIAMSIVLARRLRVRGRAGR